ncbi:MAG: hypothetical protein ACUVSQ_10275 [Pseudanabaenaceae cyanobacterium]
MYQVVLEMSGKRTHIIAEYGTAEAALQRYEELVRQNRGTPKTANGIYKVRKKPTL